jgi:hypothetical protein
MVTFASSAAVISGPQVRDHDRDRGSRVRRGVDRERAAEKFQPLAHGRQSDARPGGQRGGEVEAPAVVAHARVHLGVGDRDSHLQGPRVRVQHGVADGLAEHDVQLLADLVRQLLVTGHRHRGVDGRRDSRGHVVAERLAEAADLDRRIPQFPGQPADRVQGFAQRSAGGADPCPGAWWVGVGVDVEQFEVLQGHTDRVRGAVVQLATDPTPFVPVRVVHLLE